MKYHCFLSVVFALFSAGFVEADENFAQRQEAVRFSKEADFLYEQARFEEAVEKGEVASALDPDNPDLRRKQIVRLIRHGLDILDPGEEPSFKSKETLRGIGKEVYESAMHLAVRAVDLAVSLGENDDLNDFDRRGQQLNMLRQNLVFLAENRFPTYKKAVENLNEKLLSHWIEHAFQPGIDQITDKESRRKKIGIFYNAHGIFFQYQSTDTLARAYEKMLPRLVDLVDRWGPDDGVFDVSEQFCNGFSKDVQKYLRRPVYERNKKTEEIFEQMIERLEKHPWILFTFFARTAKHRPDFHLNADAPAREKVRQYVDSLLKLLAEQPPNLSFKEYSLFYKELAQYARICAINDENHPIHSQKPLQYFRRILELAELRQEIAVECAQQSMEQIRSLRNIYDFRRRNGLPFDEDPKNLVDMEPHFKKLIAGQIALAGKSHPELAELLRNNTIKYEMSLDTPTRSKPWEKEIVFSKKEIGRAFSPFLRGEKLYLLNRDDAPDLKLLELDCRTQDLREVGIYSADVMGDIHHPRLDLKFVDDKNAYIGASGIVVLPLSSENPWSLGKEDGLPSEHVQGLGSIGGKLYAGLGEEGKPSWLVEVDLETKKWKILASSSAKEGTLPFVNHSPAASYPFFFEDLESDRLLLFVNGHSGKHDIGGLWSLDGKTGRFTQLKRFQSWAIRGQMLPNGKGILLNEQYRTLLLDLKDDAPDSVIELTCLKGYEQGSPKIANCHIRGGTVAGGYLWGILGNYETGMAWARIPLDLNSSIDGIPNREFLVSVFGSEVGLEWSRFFPLPDETGIIVEGGSGFILLRFE